MAENVSKDYSILKEVVNKIKKTSNNMPKIREEWAKLQEKKKRFFLIFDEPFGKYYIFAMMCIAALFFDFIVNNTVLIWLADLTEAPVQIFAIIFLLIDASVAIFASGIFAKDIVELDQQRSRWVKVLWAIAIVKIALFVIFVHFVYADTYEYSLIMTLVQIGFVLLIYLLLHFGGSGLLFILGVFWYNLILEMLWCQNPQEIQNRLKKYWSELNNRINKYNFSKESVLDYYDLRKGGENVR
ncbi:MAG: hypothetical protein ACLFQX_01295 [Candidatus Kapaibacterium sp.]